MSQISINAGRIELKVLCKDLNTVTEWFNFGVLLGVPYATLKEIELVYHGDIRRCRLEMFQAWIQRSHATWSSVVETLNCMGMNVLAQNLARKYGT